MLNFKLVHNSAETLLKLVNLFVKFLANLHLQLVVKFLIHHYRLVMFFNLMDHFFYHLLHVIDLGRNLDHFMLHFCMLQNTLGTKHGPIIFTIELDLFRRMDFAESNALLW